MRRTAFSGKRHGCGGTESGLSFVMVLYRRNRLPGGTFFFTVTLRDRTSRILVDQIEPLREAFRKVRRQRPFSIDAIVVLPDHLHTIWTLPPGDDDFPGRWRAIKSAFTHAVVKSGLPVARNQKGEHALWQRRYWEHTVADEVDLQRHVDYIHFNPVKHDLVERVADWPYSSFHRYVGRGILDSGWAGTVEEEGGPNFGE